MEWPWEKKMNAPNVSAVDSLIGALDDADPEVCCRAAAKAGRERNRAAVLPLVKLLYSRDRPGSKQIIAVAARALGEIGDLRAIQHLEEAGFAHVYGGPPTGVDYIYADGRIVSPEEEDVLMDQAIRDAEKKTLGAAGRRTIFGYAR
jgi:hypothetical protein